MLVPWESRASTRHDGGRAEIRLRLSTEFYTIFPQPNPQLPESMTETSAIELRVRLPRPLAEAVEQVKESDPEALNRIVAYGVTRRMIFEHLVERGGAVERVEARGD